MASSLEKNNIESLGKYNTSFASPLPQEDICLSEKDKLREYRRRNFKTLYKIQKYARQDLSNVDGKAWSALNRLQKCYNVNIDKKVTVCFDEDIEKAYLKGVMKCGHVWNCPCCCSVVQNVRAGEIDQTLNYIYKRGYIAVMITLTLSHKFTDSLEWLIDRHAKITKAVKSGKLYKEFRERICCIGEIKGNEITIGDNGFHYHCHMLLLVRPDDVTYKGKTMSVFDYIEDFYKSRWKKQYLKKGFSFDSAKSEQDFDNHAINVIKSECHSSDYMAKYGIRWGADKEIAKGGSKRSYGGVSFFELPYLLEDMEKELKKLSKDTNEYKNLHNKYLLYTRYMYEYLRTNKRQQLRFSNGLKSMVGLVEVSDEEIIEKDAELSKDLFYMSIGIYYSTVVRTKRHANLHDEVEKGNCKTILDWIHYCYMQMISPLDRCS